MLALIGLSHHTAPIAVRERAALEPEQVAALLKGLVAQPEIAEALIVSTCNRVEILVSSRFEENPEQLLQIVQRQLEAKTGPLSPHVYHHTAGDAVQHVFRVASSLDSLVVGEPQILGQLKKAWDIAQELGTVGPQLRRVTTHAVRVAKRVRTETALGVGQVSVPTVAVDLTRQIFGQLKDKRAVLVGAGEMGQSVAKQLRAEGSALSVVGRTRARAEELASALKAVPLGLEDLEAALLEADVVIAMTSAQQHVIDKAMVARLNRKRRGRNLFFVDLSVPRNIDPAVETLENVFLYNVDDLSQIVQQRKSSRQEEAQRAEALVVSETQNFRRAASAEQVTPTVVALRQRLVATLRAEHERSQRGKLKHLSATDHQHIAKLLDAAVNKVLHTPTVLLRQTAADPEAAEQLDTLVSALNDLFELEPDSVETDESTINGLTLGSPSDPPPAEEISPA
jgi:glutamyl-tRNA reductase